MTEREKDALVRELLKLNVSYATMLKIYTRRVEEAERR